jgi:hypothetical protein
MAIAATATSLSPLSPYEALRRINGTTRGNIAATSSGTTPSSVVSLSPQARQRLAAENQDQAVEAAAVAAGEVPLRHLAMPDWFADYTPVVLQSADMSNGPVSIASTYAKGYEIQRDHPQETSAYSQRVSSLYQQVLQENGIGTTVSHYQAMHEDASLSQDLRRQFHEALASDPQAQQLRAALGITLPDLTA